MTEHDRICPGMFLALNSIYIAVAGMLYALNISKATDEKGEEILPEIEYDGFIWLVLLQLLSPESPLVKNPLSATPGHSGVQSSLVRMKQRCSLNERHRDAFKCRLANVPG